MATAEELHDRLAPYHREAERLIEARAEVWQGADALVEAMRYAALGAGKRIRPILTLATAEACGCALAAPNPAWPGACAVELVHTYSLVHDDLPAMDDDAERRGRPTVHVEYGEAMAVLAGDALLTDAFEVLADGFSGAGLSTIGRVTSVAVLARAAGSQGMVGGQVLDVSGVGANAEDLAQMHAAKTGALFAASAELGAVSATSELAIWRQARAYGAALGAMFQLRDDALDAEDAAKAGSSEEGVNLVALMGPAAARDRIRALRDDALARVDALPGDGDVLRFLVEWTADAV